MPDSLIIWTITDRPSDFPEHICVTPHIIEKDTHAPYRHTCLCTDLDEARNSLPAGACHLGREPGDDPVIVESWI